MKQPKQISDKKAAAGDNAIDMHIGRRVQLRRNMLGITQKDLAAMCGVTFQQIQKYESADSRISASRLFKIGIAMDTPVSFFFMGLPKQDGGTPAAGASSRRDRVAEPSNTPNDPLVRTDSLQLITLYWKLPNDTMRENVMNLLRSMCGATTMPDTSAQ